MRRMLALFRMCSLAAAMALVVIGITMHRASAQISEALTSFGRRLADITEWVPHSTPRRLFVNGIELRFLTIGTTLPIRDALDRFEGLCKLPPRAEFPSATRLRLAVESLGQSDEDLTDRAGIVRQESDREGVLACLDVGATSGEAFLGRLLEFGRTKRLSALGQLRYAMARRTGETTTLVVLWTEGDTLLGDAFPRAGDAPGRDIANVPRPAQSRRILSAFEEKLPYGIVAYRVDGLEMQSVAADIVQRLARAEWTATEARPGLIRAVQGRRRLIVRISERRKGVVVVTISDLG